MGEWRILLFIAFCAQLHYGDRSKSEVWLYVLLYSNESMRMKCIIDSTANATYLNSLEHCACTITMKYRVHPTGYSTSS